MDSIPCIGALTCAANCDSRCFIRPSSASRCSLAQGEQLHCHVIARRCAQGSTNEATTSRGFCVLTHCSVNLLHVEHGVSPSHLILRRRQRSQALETDLRRGCQSLTAVGEKVAGASPAGNDACYHQPSVYWGLVTY